MERQAECQLFGVEIEQTTGHDQPVAVARRPALKQPAKLATV